MYQKLKRTWSNGYSTYMPEFKKVFPELSRVDSEELCDRFIELDLDFYTTERIPVVGWVRLTLPFALVFLLLMFLGLPFNFIFTGCWGYSLKKTHLSIYNWFKHLGINL